MTNHKTTEPTNTHSLRSEKGQATLPVDFDTLQRMVVKAFKAVKKKKYLRIS